MAFFRSVFALLAVFLPALSSVRADNPLLTTESLPYNFTLTALNTTLPNVNTTGVPLVLGQAGATGGITFHVTSTYASFPYNDYPTLALTNSQLRAFTKTNHWVTNATLTTSGGTLGWLTTTIYNTNAPQIYSAVTTPPAEAPTSRFQMLAAHNRTDLWSLCTFDRNARLPQVNVVFNVSDVPAFPEPRFDPAQCYSVVLNIIPV